MLMKSLQLQDLYASFGQKILIIFCLMKNNTDFYILSIQNTSSIFLNINLS